MASNTGINPEEVNHPDHALSYDDVRGKGLELSAEDKQIVERRMAALQLILADQKEQKAKYKIEVRFAKSRSTWKPTPGLACWWESGKKFHGGGDEKVYLCPGRRLKVNDCESPIPEEGIGGGVCVCPSCGRTWKGSAVIGELAYNLTMQNWAKVILKDFLNLESNADIVLKHSNDDIRSISLSQESFKRTEKLDRVRGRRARAVHIYPLGNIIKDLSRGSDPLRKFHEFLTA